MSTTKKDMTVEEMLNAPGARPLLIGEAQKVFNLKGISYFPAFSMFRKMEDLAIVIEAKNKNVFDYGQCIRTADGGSLTFPNNVPTIMQSIDMAESGRFEDIDLRALGLETPEGEVLVKLSDLCPGSDAAKPKTAVKKKATTRKRRTTARKADVVRHEVSEPVTESHDPSQDSKLFESLSEAFKTLDSVVNARMDASDASLLEVKGGIVALASFLNTINANIKTVASYLDPYAELESPSDEALASLAKILSEQDSLAGTQPEEEVAESEAPHAEEKPVRKRRTRKPKVEEKEVEAPKSDAISTVEFTRAELKSMSIEELRDIAESIGVPKARSLPFKQSLVSRICKVASLS